MEEILSITEASKLLKRTVRCLQIWDKNGTLKAHRTKTNRRFYFKSELLEYFNLLPEKENKKIIAYSRVSSSNQKSDLKNQIEVLQDYCNGKLYSNVEFVDEIGGGLNFKRKKFNEILFQIIDGKIDKLIIAHKDRLSRFGFDLIEIICKKYGTEIEILTNDKCSPEEEMVRDLMTIIHCFSSRLYGLRNYRKELKEKLK